MTDRPGPWSVFIALVRRPWRWLTSMRTALLLLFLLALAAIPGSLLPQRNLSVEGVQRYYRDHPSIAPTLDRIGAFDVFASPWFSAIYLLLFISLIGCLVPRTRAHVLAVVRVPPDAPARMDRLPAYAQGSEPTGDRASTAAALRDLLRRRRFRVRLRERDGQFTVSAEKGYLKETGNILFHLSLLAVLIGVAYGALYGYHANRLVVSGPDQGFCNTLQQYDEYGLGARVDPASLEPFCLNLTNFTATYQPNGEPASYDAAVTYTVGDGPTRSKHIQVNDPLRLSGGTVYLVGHGYAPVLEYTDKYGKTQTVIAPFIARDSTLTSAGVAQFPDANVPPGGSSVGSHDQVAFSGLFLPTLPDDPSVGRSAFPAARNPALMLFEYRGNLGLDAGIPHSVYSLDQHQIDTGALKKIGTQIMLRPGQSVTLADGGTLRFVGTRTFATLTVRKDPGKPIVLIGAIFLVLGLITMLAGKRRRVWLRVPASGGVQMGALARSEYPGFDEEFQRLVGEARMIIAPGAGPPGAGPPGSGPPGSPTVPAANLVDPSTDPAAGPVGSSAGERHYAAHTESPSGGKDAD